MGAEQLEAWSRAALGKRRPGEALCALEGLAALGPLDGQRAARRLALLDRLCCWRELARQVERDAPLPGWLRDYDRGRAQIGLDRFAEAERLLARAVRGVRQAGGEGASQRASSIDYHRRRAKWKERLRADQAPAATFEGYRLDEAFRPAKQR